MSSIYSFFCFECAKHFQIEFGSRQAFLCDGNGVPICLECNQPLIRQLSTTETNQLLGELPMADDKREYAERKNTGKPQMSYVDMHCLSPCARVLEFGATKYSRNNWKKGMPVTKILDSLMRHIGDLQDGKVIDDESKLAIIGHIQCNAMFLGNPNNQDDITEDGSLYK